MTLKEAIKTLERNNEYGNPVILGYRSLLVGKEIGR